MTRPNGKPSPNPYRDEALREIAEGRERLAAASATAPKAEPLADVESTARARAKLEGRTKP